MSASPTRPLTKQENPECSMTLPPLRGNPYSLPATATIDATVQSVLGPRRSSFSDLSRPPSPAGSILSTRTVQFPPGEGRPPMGPQHPRMASSASMDALRTPALGDGRGPYGSQSSFRISSEFVPLEEDARAVAILSVSTAPGQLFLHKEWIQDPEVVGAACRKDYEVLRKMVQERRPIPPEVLDEAVEAKKDDAKEMFSFVQIHFKYLAKASERLQGDKGFLAKCLGFYLITHKNFDLLENPIYQTFRTQAFILEVFQQLQECRFASSRIEKLLLTLKPDFLAASPSLALGVVQWYMTNKGTLYFREFPVLLKDKPEFVRAFVGLVKGSLNQAGALLGFLSQEFIVQNPAVILDVLRWHWEKNQNILLFQSLPESLRRDLNFVRDFFLMTKDLPIEPGAFLGLLDDTFMTQPQNQDVVVEIVSWHMEKHRNVSIFQNLPTSLQQNTVFVERVGQVAVSLGLEKEFIGVLPPTGGFVFPIVRAFMIQKRSVSVFQSLPQQLRDNEEFSMLVTKQARESGVLLGIDDIAPYVSDKKFVKKLKAAWKDESGGCCTIL